MSDINNSLIGFLTKKSLFSQSPDKRKSLSKEPKKSKIAFQSPTNRMINFNQLIDSKTQRSNDFNTFMESQSNRNFQTKASEPRFKTTYFDNQQDDQISQKKMIRQQRRNLHLTQNPKVRSNYRNPEQQTAFGVKHKQNINSNQVQPKNLQWSSLLNYATSFQSARLQSIQCLQNLSVKIRSQISSINNRIDNFNNKMRIMLTNQLKRVKENLYDIIQKTFAESQQMIRIYMQKQQQQLAGEMITMKSKLQKEYNKIQGMKDELNKPNWRKVAGQLLASQLEKDVEKTLRQSSLIVVGPWQLGDFGEKKIKTLEANIKDILIINK